jgi:hypothetical protein
MNDTERLNHARWTLERQLTWIAAADAKVGVVVTLHVAMLGGLGAAYTASAAKSSWVNGMATAYAILALLSLICAAMALWPRTDGPKNSMIYFGCVVKGRCEDYVDDFKKKGDDFFLADLAEQVHRNAQIAAKKISFVGTAMKVAFAGSLFWIVAVALLVMPK